MKNYERKNRAAYAGAAAFIFLANGFAVVLQFFKGDVLDSAVAGQTDAALRYGLLLIGFILLEIAFFYLHKIFSAKFITGCTKLLKHDIFKSVLRRGYVAYKERPQGEYISKYTNEADMISARRFTVLPMFWNVLFKIIAISAGLFILDARIAVVTLFLLTTPLYIPKLIEKRLQRIQSEYLKAVEVSLAKVSDWLSGFEVIKNFSIERKILERFANVNNAAMNTMLADLRINALAQLITTLISYLSYFIVLACAAWLVLRGDFTAGDFFVAVGMIDQLSYPLISLAGIIRQLVAIKTACFEMRRFIDEAGTAQTKPDVKTLRNEITFRDVTFAYENKKPVLTDFNLTVKKGNRCLIKGPSGCGKTTAVNLLLKYYEAYGGSIEIDGAAIDGLSGTYGLITVVRQEAVLFNDSLRNNLTMYEEIPDNQLIDMLKTLGLDKFANVEALDGAIAESGANLSGGEKKRICIARALLRNTDVLILDEPLANLDNDTVNRIEDLMLSITDRTLLVVSHQFNPEKLTAFNQVIDLGTQRNTQVSFDEV